MKIFKLVDKLTAPVVEKIPDIMDGVNQLIDKKREHDTIAQANAVDNLVKYKQLLDDGVITEEEFAKKKQELLRRKLF